MSTSLREEDTRSLIKMHLVIEKKEGYIQRRRRKCGMG